MSTYGRTARIVALLALAALFVLAPVTGAAPRQQAADSIDVGDQPLVNQSITLRQVNASQDGWITGHLDQNNSPGPVLGYTQIKQGTNTNVVIKLSQNVEPGTKLWPMLHIDAGTLGTFEFPGPDAPVIVEGDIVMKQIAITDAPAAPSTLPTTGGADATTALLLSALALLAAGALVRQAQPRR